MNKINYGHIFKEFVGSVGYELLSEYKNTQIKVKLKCNKGHEYSSSTPNNFKKGSRCPICAGKCPIQAKEKFIQTLEQEGYELLSEYNNTKTKVKIRCNYGHEYKVKPDKFKSGQRCPVCVGTCPIQAEKEFKELVESVGCELLSEYKGVMKKVKIRCNKGHEYKVRPNSFKRGRRCPVCFERRSQKEINILNYVKYSINEEVISGDRTNVINPRTGNYLELDIWIPELRKAIEFNGTYWHSGEYSMYKDEIKREYCNKNGIDLMIIDELEYDNGLELCLNGIDNFLGIEKSL